MVVVPRHTERGDRMARMIPFDGPNFSESRRAEPDIYWRLSKQLSDDYTVIHSLPWLASAASEIDGRSVPTGEIDFLVLHARYGILAVEIKGGHYKYDRARFVYLRTHEEAYPIQQMRRGAHGLAKWLVSAGGPAVRIGYAFLFPDCEMTNRRLPPAMIDHTVDPSHPIVLDCRDLTELGARLIETMQYWHKHLGGRLIGSERLEEIVDLICPRVDYRPSWLTRIQNDTRLWLRLTDEQADCLKLLKKETRFAVEGRPGTGKTVIALSLARQLSEEGHRVLFLVYNRMLHGFLRSELNDTTVNVMTFYGLCRKAGSINATGNHYEAAFRVLGSAIDSGTLPSYDVLIIDEVQVFKEDWMRKLALWFEGKQITIFGDDTQAFDFEEPVLVRQQAEIIGSPEPFVLTISIRSPKAVFERLNEIWPANYQQHSLRDYEENTLNELFAPSPLDTLMEALTQFRNEQIPPESITLLYASLVDEGDVHFFEYLVENGYVGKSTSIAKFRGVESPVIVVWATGGISDAELFCGYSRATTKCVVIYDLIQVAARKLGQFGERLIESETTPETIREAATNLWKVVMADYMQLRLTQIVVRTSTIFWCHDWAAWIIVVNRPTDKVPSIIWRDHLAVHFKYPVFFWDSSCYQYLEVIRNPLSIDDEVPSKWDGYFIKRCDVCGKWTPHRFLSYTEHECLHQQLDKNAPLPSEAKVLENLDRIIAAPENYSRGAKQQVGLILGSLGRYRRLSDKHQCLLSKYINTGSRILYRLSALLAGIEFLDLAVGEYLTLASFRSKYPAWFPELNQVASWKSTSALGIAVWIQRGWASKQKTGVYVRQPIAELDECEIAT